MEVLKSIKEDWTQWREDRERYSTGLIPSAFLGAEETPGIFLFGNMWSYHVSVLSYPVQERHLTHDNKE